MYEACPTSLEIIRNKNFNHASLWPCIYICSSIGAVNVISLTSDLVPIYASYLVDIQLTHCCFIILMLFKGDFCSVFYQRILLDFSTHAHLNSKSLFQTVFDTQCILSLAASVCHWPCSPQAFVPNTVHQFLLAILGL